jgi:hypothetical protein
LAAVPVRDHPAVWLGVAGSAAIQAPLGWAVIRRVGQPGFLTAWGLGLVVRIAFVAVLALVAGPALGLRPEPLLLTAVGTLFMLLLVEGFVTFVELPGTVQR